MRILFLTLVEINDVGEHGIYTDLLREFLANGHDVYVVSSVEKRKGIATHLVDSKDSFPGKCTILKVQTGNIQKTGKIEKGIATVTLEGKYLKAIKHYFADVTFDLVLYSTPPITFSKVVSYIKKRDCAKTYLLLKDIFPQNAVDIGMMSNKGMLYRFFRNKEIRLYALSDFIGCMSPANVDYIIKHNPGIESSRVHVNPNSIDPNQMIYAKEEKTKVRETYGIPQDKRVFVYGGNLGKPQSVPFIVDCLKTQAEKEDRFFLICGAGTDYTLLKEFFDAEKPKNMKLINGLPRDEYDKLVHACDVGMIFLDHRFTIPNFPSRLLSYMEASIPALACTDSNTDIGDVIVDGGFGWKCSSDNPQSFAKTVDKICATSDIIDFGEDAYKYLLMNYTTKVSYERIIAFLNQ